MPHRCAAVTLVTKHLRKRPIEGRVAPVADDAGIVIGAVVVFRDARVPDYSEQEQDIDDHLSRPNGIINLRGIYHEPLVYPVQRGPVSGL